MTLQRTSFVLALAALTIAVPACKNNDSSTTAPAPSASFTPNPSITAATVSVTIQSTPAAYVPVQISTPNPQSTGRPGTPFAIHKTGKLGMTTFSHLNPSQIYCWVAVLGPNQTSSRCAGWEVWQLQTVQLGN